MGLIADMKKSVLVNDFSAMHELSAERLESLQQEEVELLTQLDALTQNCSDDGGGANYAERIN